MTHKTQYGNTENPLIYIKNFMGIVKNSTNWNKFYEGHFQLIRRPYTGCLKMPF